MLTKRARRLRQVAGKLDWPANVWMGVSVESAKELARIDDLRRVPAAVRFLSCEPLLGPLDGLDVTGIDWVIAGGESGPRFRPVEEEWVTGIRDVCTDAGVAFFFKLLCTIPVTSVRSRSDFGLPARFASRQRSRRWRGGLVGHVDSRTPGDQFGRLVGSVGRFGQVTFPDEGEGRVHPLDSDGETRSAAGTMAVGRQKTQPVLSFNEIVEPLLQEGLVRRTFSGDLVAVTGGSGQRVEDAVIGGGPLVPAPRCGLMTCLPSFREGRTNHGRQRPQCRTYQANDRRCHSAPLKVEAPSASGSRTRSRAVTFRSCLIVAAGGRA